jgi:type II secretory pathway pseudopilin PulG
MAREAGEDLNIVVLATEPVSGATPFADAVLDELGAGVVFVIAPQSVAVVGFGDVYTEAELGAALDRAVDLGGDDGDYALTFVAALTGTSLDGGAAAGDGDGGGGSGVLVMLVVIVVAAGVAFWWWNRREKRRRAETAAARLAKARAQIQEQVDAVANDILELEDEVRMADDPRADRFFEEAAETYRRVVEQAEGAETPGALLELSDDLDEAIWRLDCAEAVLDGNPLPDRPPRPAPEELVPAPVGAPAPAPPAPPVEYRRRSGRRSSYSGPMMRDLLLMLGGSMLGGRARGGPSASGAPWLRSDVPAARRRASRRGAGTPRPPTEGSRRGSSQRGTGGSRVRIGRRRRR